MRLGSLIVIAFTLAGCPGGDGAIGERCNDHGDCSGELQCATGVCVPRCTRAPECGDGFACDPSGICKAATGQPGDACSSEVECSAGLACQIENTVNESTGDLIGSCVAENGGRPAAATCESDHDCRNGTCALGHCVDLCTDTRDCGAGTSCTRIPRVEATGRMFGGCLQSRGALRWSIPIQGPTSDVLLPMPESARGVSVLFTVEDQSQKVGATSLTAPSGTQLIDGQYSYYTNPYVRHRPELGQSVLAMPSTPNHDLQAGVYAVRVRSLRPSSTTPNDVQGTATPTMTAVIKLDASVQLDLHFHFLNFDDHPCEASFGGKLDAETAQNAAAFQSDYLGTLSTILNGAGLSLGTRTFTDLHDHPDLDGLDIENAGALLALGSHAVGINVFFVRTLSPVGLQAIGPNPGPAGIENTRQSGIVIGLDTLCYRTWSQLARLTAHELARYMGLYNNIELDPTHVDLLDDTDTSSTNLMFYSELGGAFVTNKQRDVLSRSPVLR